MNVLGIDIGGSGMKAAPVNLETGEMLTDRFRIDTPQPATPKAMAKVFKRLIENFEWEGPIGAAFPARVKNGVAKTASNIHRSWIGTNVEELFHEATGCPVTVLNDADAAGVAEMEYGAGKGRKDLVLLLTFGTGIGSALFWNGELVPNTEFGHLRFRKKTTAEEYAADRIRKDKDLSWPKWGKRVRRVLQYVDFLLAPDLIIVGGGVSRPQKWDLYASKLKDVNTEVVPAQLENEAGIIGAAYAAVHEEVSGHVRA